MQLQQQKGKTYYIYWNEGYENGRKSLLWNLERKMEDKYEEGVEKGMNLGREEGYTIAKEGFDEIIKVKRAREAAKAQTSVKNGVDACLVPTAAVSTQTTALIVTAPSTMTSVSTQTNSTTSTTMPEAQTLVKNGVGAHLATTGTQTESPALTVDAASQTDRV